jgi:exopolyphosphatase/guanosine-5'-triphosphate,3'-diphosphate pyrophosphatase
LSAPVHEETFAAVDLGSNSFHLLVARREHGELRVLDRIREMVRLGGGLNSEGELDADTRQRATACLAIFEQRLRGIPDGNIRAVGTQTFRRMKDANAFLTEAESALGCNIDIIGGHEEARLIYLGVSQGVSGHDERKLVIDIGGGSTELVIGESQEIIELESLQYGCVSVTRQYFGTGKINQKSWKKALRAVRSDMQELQLRYTRAGWTTAIGSSGTLRAITSICRMNGWCERDVDFPALKQLKEALLQFESVAEVSLEGLSDKRQPVLVGGLVIAYACFKTLGIKSIKESEFALREGVLHDLLGRIEHRDPRDKTVQAFSARYGVDREQAERVKRCALEACGQIADDMFLGAAHRELLAWAADLHETGLGISHSQFQQHSGYLVENSDMAGFTNQERLFLATLVRYQRGTMPAEIGSMLPSRLHEPLRVTLFCLRFACILCRTRDDTAVPAFKLRTLDHVISVSFSEDWIDTHPLTIADLQQEYGQLEAVGLRFTVEGVDDTGEIV